jgi:hypothetical protein
MKIFVDGNQVFVTGNNFVNLQESDAVFGSFWDFLKAAFMVLWVKIKK